MAIPKCKDFEDYNNYPSETNPTTNAQMQEYMKNQNDLVKQIASVLWQPQTFYVAGQFVFSASMPSGAFAVCTTAGQSGITEPSWGTVGDNVSDSGVSWNIRKFSGDYNDLINKPTQPETYTKEEVDTALENYLPLSGGTMSGAIETSATVLAKRNLNTDVLELYGGTTNKKGGYLKVYGNEYPDPWRRGSFCLGSVSIGGAEVELVGNTGILEWGGRRVVVSEEDSNNCVRLSNGLQICFGTANGGNGKVNTHTFPQAFSSIRAVICTGVMGTSTDTFDISYSRIVTIRTTTNTNFTWQINSTTSNSGTGCRYIAIGQWE